MLERLNFLYRNLYFFTPHNSGRIRKSVRRASIKKYNLKTFKSRGFTLIELLVVIAIISLLVSILLPSLKKAKDLALRSACAAQLRGVGMALCLYAGDNDGAFPNDQSNNSFGWASLAASFYGTTIGSSGVEMIDPYVEAEQMFCPAHRTPLVKERIAAWGEQSTDIGYFAYCGREKVIIPQYSFEKDFLPDSPMNLATARSTDLLIGDLSSDHSYQPARELYNNHPLEDGGNWATVDGAVTWKQSYDLTEVYLSSSVQLLYPHFRD